MERENAALKERVFERLGQIALTLGAPARLKLVQLLAQGPKTVETLSALSGQSFANTSQHLQRLAKEGLVRVTRDGVSRIYRIENTRVLRLWEDLQDLAHEIAPDLDRAEAELTDPSLRSRLSLKEVLREVEENRAVLIDVRPIEESGYAKAEGAMCLPLGELKKGWESLPKRKPLFVYCRGRYCEMATVAVRFLRSKGLKAFRLRDSAFRINSWRRS